jgi:tRNA threonylcarbamoyladenosine biosynthesis protein TsaB
MYLLCIDTGTDRCSVALCDEDVVLSERNSARDFTHAAVITIYIQECLNEAGIGIGQLSAIALSSGPGSYTGLRVGASVAKGICFAKGIPLIAIDSLTSLAYGVGQYPCGIIVPMIDARRMDVYTAVYDENFEVLKPMQKMTIDDAFLDMIKNRKAIAVGDAIDKCGSLLIEANICIGHNFSSASYLKIPAWKKYHLSQSEDLDYFSPQYLNKPNITVNKKKLPTT